MLVEDCRAGEIKANYCKNYGDGGYVIGGGSFAVGKECGYEIRGFSALSYGLKAERGILDDESLMENFGAEQAERL